MVAEPGHSLILWTVRLGVVCYCAAVWLWAVPVGKRDQRQPWFRILWTAAWLLVVAHVICAFHFQHRWSHTAALAHTAEMTQRVVGWYWSGGLYINYAFLLLWGADIWCLWFRDAPAGHSAFGIRPLAMQLLAAFMMFNATAVFGPAFWIPLAAVFLLAVMTGRRLVRPATRQDARE